MQNNNLNSINIVVFGSDLPTAGVVGNCQTQADSLHIHYELDALKHEQVIHFANFNATVGGFDHNQLQLNWQQESANFMLMPTDAAAQKALYAALPLGSIKGLKSWKTSTKSQSMVWNAVLYSAGFLALSFIIFIWQYDNVVGWAAGKVSMETEKKIGDSVLGSLNIDTSKPQTGAAIEAVRKIGDKLTKGSRYKYQFYVVENKDINAFAVPGGTIVVNSGLLEKADSPNELAAVLAHEIQHVEQRHSLKNMLNSAGIAAVVMLVLGDTNAVMMIMAQQISTQYFSRQVEAEADLKGLDLLDKNLIDASGMATFFKKMEAAYKDKNGAVNSGPAWFSSHPDTLARIKAAEAYVARHPCKLCTKLTWDKTAILDDLDQLQSSKQDSERD